MSSGSLEAKACCSKEETMAVQASLIKGTEAASKPGYKASTAPVKERVSSRSKTPTKAHSSASDAPKTIDSGELSILFEKMEEMITTKISEALTDLNTKNQTTNAPTSKVDDASSPSSA
ncbi:hypothetical protein ElyMa_003740100 [Elysia marginata]|uniref:Uncharacterized protein n=1 Tax=Elysia marginata TaxID=1093978 RepID=A0AAV4F661_9GAST|nr:hypothetical protein ElyMa_003740100 [Elysia marginata]